MLLIIFVVFALIGMIVRYRLRSKFKKYSQIPISSGMSGAEIAQKMLYDNGIGDVRITCIPGRLTDHYNPADRTVNLSEEVYHGRNAASAAVAAHECGHAVQHAAAYGPLKLRSALVPLQNISASIINLLFFIGIGGIFFGFLPYYWVALGLCAAYGVMTLASIVTLPVEFDASNRALAWIENNRIVNSQEYEMSKDALWWAATTYVIAALGSLATFLYYASIVFSGRD